MYSQGSADANTGYFGKVYDRADDMRVLASIEGYEGDCETRWVPEPGVAASFAEHAHLADLPELCDDESLTPGGCDCQFTALLALALYSNQATSADPDPNQFRGVVSSSSSALPLMRMMLRALANPSSAAHAENTVVQVLCSDGLPLETICTFACGRYPIFVENDPPPNCLDWLLRDNLPLMQAIRHHRAGDDTMAMAVFEEWGGGSDVLYAREWDHGELDDEDGEMKVDECIAFAEKLSLGLADNEDFWSWIARHSPLVQESKAWFKRETIEELMASQDSNATEKDMVETQTGPSQADADEVKEGTQQEACARVEEAASRVALFDQLKDLEFSEQVARELSEVPTLVAQLQSGSDDAKAEAAATLQNLAVNADNQVAIAKEEGALAALVALLHHWSAAGKEKAAEAVKFISRNIEIKNRLLQLDCPASALWRKQHTVIQWSWPRATQCLSALHQAQLLQTLKT